MKLIQFFSVITILTLFSLACSVTQQASKGADEMSKSVTVTEVWASDTLLRTPESVLFDKKTNIIYVANVNMNPWEMDGNGFISRLDMRGNIIELRWAEGLNGPKGMGIIGNSMYVADVDQVVEIDLVTGNIKKRYPGEDNPTFNDITIIDNTIYISGSNSQKIFKLENGELVEWLADDLGRPNGLFAESDRLLLLTSGTGVLQSIDYSTQQRTTLAQNLGHGDGIVPAGGGAYVASSWRGKVFYLTPDFKQTVLIDTEADNKNTADIEYIIDKNLLLVPTFFDNRVVAYEINR